MRRFRKFLKKKIKKLLNNHRYSSESYIRYLKDKGMRIGSGTRLFSPETIIIDSSRAWLVEIGNNVQITADVTILTHGFDWSVIKGVSGEVLGSSGKVKIGNNVFIGTDTLILKCVTIGDNVIIGAGSIVTKDIPDNCVAVGSPARPIMSISDYYEKRKACQYEEASELVREYRLVYGKEPGAKELSEFFWLFTNDGENLDESWKRQMKQAGNETYSYEILSKHKPMFNSMEEFLDSIK